MKMPKVTACDVTRCAYNVDSNCHALAITIGDDTPRCDTFMRSSSKGGDSKSIAGVGACKVNDCMFNRGLECHATDIRVGNGPDEADCLTYRHK
jgi:hypothetical protein